jgi:hypothetical protein
VQARLQTLTVWWQLKGLTRVRLLSRVHSWVHVTEHVQVLAQATAQTPL